MMFTRMKIRWLRFRFRHILLDVLISACMACLVWLYTHSRTRNTIDRVPVPVQVQIAAHQRDQYTLEMPEQRTIMASFSGSNSRIREVRRKLQRGLLKATLTVTIPEEKKAEAMICDVLRVFNDSIPAPVGVNVEVGEETVPVTIHRLAERTLPVQLEYTGEARVSQIKMEPATVRVRGPKTVLDRASVIPTQPYAVQTPAETASPTTANMRDQVALVSELEGRPIQTNPATVQFRCLAAPKRKIYVLTDVPIHFLCPKECPWKPRFGSEQAGKVTLKLIGPVTEQTPPILAFVDLTSGNLARGRNLEPLRLQLSKDFQLVEPATQLVPFYLDESERPMTTGQKTSSD